MKYLRKHRNIILRILDIIIVIVAYYAATFLVDGSISKEILIEAGTMGLIAAAIYEIMLSAFQTYKNITRYENGNDYLIYILICATSCILSGIVQMILPVFHSFELRAGFAAGLIIVVGIIGYRVLLRFILTEKFPKANNHEQKADRKRVLIIGAGEAARIVIRTMKSSMKNVYEIVGLVDDNINKVNYAISGVKILGTRNDIIKICNQYNVEVIFFTISNIDGKNRREILNICQQTKAKVRILPGTEDLIRNKHIMDNFRDVEIEDLLGRDAIHLDNKEIDKLIQGNPILVTGAGGSIGSELCRQIIQHKPSKLIMLDIYENSLYDIEMELRRNYPKQEIITVIASIREKHRLDEVFKEYRPYLVFHAAAHKHVPLMENSPLEAIKNNVFGTYNLVNCADEYGVRKFIQISTDKAVNPTNIMGATKRLCEMIIQAKNKDSKTEYAAVRFGNVLGSNGSVIPLFKKQIAAGGPVTVTDKEITRFFMTIPEAVSLVLQAMTYAKGGEIFVLDMGEPVKIYDMAEKLIRLSGYEPNVDMRIEVTGLRPGEKLYEELLTKDKDLQTTKHEKIFIEPPSKIDMKMLKDKLIKLNELVKTSNNEQKDKIKETIKEVVPTYHEQNK